MPPKRPTPLSDHALGIGGETKGSKVLGLLNNGIPLNVKNTFIDVPSGLTPSRAAKSQIIATAPAWSSSHEPGFMGRALVGTTLAAAPTYVQTPSSSGGANGTPLASAGTVCRTYRGTPASSMYPSTPVMTPSLTQQSSGSPGQQQALPLSSYPALSTTYQLSPARSQYIAQTVSYAQVASRGVVSSVNSVAAPVYSSAVAPAPVAPAKTVGEMRSMGAQALGIPAEQVELRDANDRILTEDTEPVEHYVEGGIKALPKPKAQDFSPGGADGEDDDEDDDDDVPAHLRNPADAPAPPPGAEHPSIGSEAHNDGSCKRCCFFPRGRCTNGYDCVFCHYEHDKRKRKNKKKKKKDSTGAAVGSATPIATLMAAGGVQMQILPGDQSYARQPMAPQQQQVIVQQYVDVNGNLVTAQPVQQVQHVQQVQYASPGVVAYQVPQGRPPQIIVQSPPQQHLQQHVVAATTMGPQGGDHLMAGHTVYATSQQQIQHPLSADPRPGHAVYSTPPPFAGQVVYSSAPPQPPQIHYDPSMMGQAIYATASPEQVVQTYGAAASSATGPGYVEMASQPASTVVYSSQPYLAQPYGQPIQHMQMAGSVDYGAVHHLPPAYAAPVMAPPPMESPKMARQWGGAGQTFGFVESTAPPPPMVSPKMHNVTLGSWGIGGGPPPPPMVSPKLLRPSALQQSLVAAGSTSPPLLSPTNSPPGNEAYVLLGGPPCSPAAR